MIIDYLFSRSKATTTTTTAATTTTTTIATKATLSEKG